MQILTPTLECLALLLPISLHFDEGKGQSAGLENSAPPLLKCLSLCSALPLHFENHHFFLLNKTSSCLNNVFDMPYAQAKVFTPTTKFNVIACFRQVAFLSYSLNRSFQKYDISNWGVCIHGLTGQGTNTGAVLSANVICMFPGGFQTNIFGHLNYVKWDCIDMFG